MKRIYVALSLILMPLTAPAQPPLAQTPTGAIIDAHILPRFEALAVSTEALAKTASQECAPTSARLRTSYGTAFDAWIAASHLRFGPTEEEDRAFALAFWPDSRGATPRTLASLIAKEDPIGASPLNYADMSIAARGFYALEFLLYDETLSSAGEPAYICTLLQTVTVDMATTSAAILDRWQMGFAEEMRAPGPERLYRSEEEALQEIFKALSTGLQFTSESRLGRPLGNYDRPRPSRAEARRSGRSARHVLLSLDALEDLALRLTGQGSDLQGSLATQFDSARERLIALDDPVFASVADPQSRLKLEIVQQSVDAIRTTITQELGPTLGVAAGFNSLDGD